MRSALIRHPLIAFAVLLAALLVRVAVPAGFMPVSDGGRLTIAMCSGHAVGVAGGGGEALPDLKQRCGFADLTLAATGSAEPVQIAAPMRWTSVAAATFTRAARVRGAAFLRPFLRGPPVPT